MLAGDDCETLFHGQAMTLKGMQAQHLFAKRELVPLVCETLGMDAGRRNSAKFVLSEAMKSAESLCTPEIEAVVDEMCPPRMFGQAVAPRLKNVIAFLSLMSQFKVRSALFAIRANYLVRLTMLPREVYHGP